MSNEKKQYLLSVIENTIYLIIWAFIFFLPVYGMTQHGDHQIKWDIIPTIWMKNLPILLFFLMHNFVLLPRLQRDKKVINYLLYASSLVLLLIAVNLYDSRDKQAKNPNLTQQERLVTPSSPETPRYHLERTLPFREQNIRPGQDRPHFLQDNPPNIPFIFMTFLPIPILLSPIVLAIFILGLNIGVKMMFQTIRDEQRIKEMERQKLQTELDYLKYQINPHFFMNTLNNIHALVDFNPEKAKETVLELSKLMRYVLYESNKPMVPLQEELAFLRHYIELMKLRYTARLELVISIHEEELPPTQVPPLLFITFVENAFKHGVSYQSPSFIHITMDVVEGRLRFFTVNSLHTAQKDSQPHGIGLANVRKRLQLLYGTHYTLDIRQREKEYQVLLLIPLQV